MKFRRPMIVIALIALVAAGTFTLLYFSEETPAPAHKQEVIATAEPSKTLLPERKTQSRRKPTEAAKPTPPSKLGSVSTPDSIKEAEAFFDVRPILDGVERPELAAILNLEIGPAGKDLQYHQWTAMQRAKGVRFRSTSPMKREASFQLRSFTGRELMELGTFEVVKTDGRGQSLGAISIDVNTLLGKDGFILRTEFWHKSRQKGIAGQRPTVFKSDGVSEKPSSFLSDEGATLIPQWRVSEYEHERELAIEDQEIQEWQIGLDGFAERSSFLRQEGSLFHFDRREINGGIVEVRAKVKLQAPMVWENPKADEISLEGLNIGGIRAYLRAGEREYWMSLRRVEGSDSWQAQTIVPEGQFLLQLRIEMFEDTWEREYEHPALVDCQAGESTRVDLGFDAPGMSILQVEFPPEDARKASVIALREATRKRLLEAVSYGELQVNFFDRWFHSTTTFLPLKKFGGKEISVQSWVFKPVFKKVPSKPALISLSLSERWEEAKPKPKVPATRELIISKGEFDIPAGTRLGVEISYDYGSRFGSATSLEEVVLSDQKETSVTVLLPDGWDFHFTLCDSFGDGGFTTPYLAHISDGKAPLRLTINRAPVFERPTSETFFVQAFVGDVAVHYTPYELTPEGREVSKRMLGSLIDEFGDQGGDYGLRRVSSKSYRLDMRADGTLVISDALLRKFPNLRLRSRGAAFKIVKPGRYPIVVDEPISGGTDVLELLATHEGHEFLIWSGFTDDQNTLDPETGPSLVTTKGHSAGYRYEFEALKKRISQFGDESNEPEEHQYGRQLLYPGDYRLRVYGPGAQTKLMPDVIRIADRTEVEVTLPPMTPLSATGRVRIQLGAKAQEFVVRKRFKVRVSYQSASVTSLATHSVASIPYFWNLAEHRVEGGNELLVEGLYLNVPLWIEIRYEDKDESFASDAIRFELSGPKWHTATIDKVEPCLDDSRHAGFPARPKDAPEEFLGARSNSVREGLNVEFFEGERALYVGEAQIVGRAYSAIVSLSGQGEKTKPIRLTFTAAEDSRQWQDNAIELLQPMLRRLAEMEKAKADEDKD